MPRTRTVPPSLLLEEQLCFPLYAASRLFTRLYQPFLEPLGITYPQYIVLLVLWQHGEQSVSQIGEKTFLESNTLTPLLKKLESKEFIARTRKPDDERVVHVSLTSRGKALEKHARAIPENIFEQMQVPVDELRTLRSILNRFVGQLNTTLREQEGRSKPQSTA